MSHSTSTDPVNEVDDFAAGIGGCGAVSATAGCADEAVGFADAGAASAVSIVRISEPCETLSPIFSLSSFTTPAAGDGTSSVALSDSRVTSGSSGCTVSPGFTNTSTTGTFLKSPISGTFTSTGLVITETF